MEYKTLIYWEKIPKYIGLRFLYWGRVIFNINLIFQFLSAGWILIKDEICIVTKWEMKILVKVTRPVLATLIIFYT